MNKSYTRSSDGATMVEIAPHQYVNRSISHPHEPLADGQQGKTAEATARAWAEQFERA